MLYDAKRFDLENNLFRVFFIYFFVAESPVFFGVGLTTRGKVFYNYYIDRGDFRRMPRSALCRRAACAAKPAVTDISEPLFSTQKAGCKRGLQPNSF